MDDGVVRKIWFGIKWVVFSVAAICMFGLSLVCTVNDFNPSPTIH